MDIITTLSQLRSDHPILFWVLATIAGGVITSAAGELAKHSWKRWRPGPKEPELPKPVAWEDSLIARVLPADVLRRDFEVPVGTRIVVVDKGVAQRNVVFDPGPHRGKDAAEELDKARILPKQGAMALQYRIGEWAADTSFNGLNSGGIKPYDDVTVRLDYKVQVEASRAEKLLDWHLSHDHRITMEEVEKTLNASLEPAVVESIRSLDADLLGQRNEECRREVEARLGKERDTHGLRVNIIELKPDSAAARRDRQSTREIERLKFESAQRLQKEEIKHQELENYRLMEHDGLLKTMAREVEKGALVQKVQQYRIDKAEAEHIITSDLKSAGAKGGRQALLTEIQRWHLQKRPCSLQLSLDHSSGSRNAFVPPVSASRRRIGDALSFTVISELSGYLYLINLGTSGVVSRLFPNANASDNRVSADVPFFAGGRDFEIILGGPPGVEHFLAIISKCRIIGLDHLPVNEDGLLDTSSEDVQTVRTFVQELTAVGEWTWADVAVVVSN